MKNNATVRVPLPSSSIIIRLSRVAVWSITADSNYRINKNNEKEWLKIKRKTLIRELRMRQSDQIQANLLKFRCKTTQLHTNTLTVPSQPWTWTLPFARHRQPRLWPGCSLSQRGWRCRKARSSPPAPALWYSPPRGCTYSCHPGENTRWRAELHVVRLLICLELSERDDNGFRDIYSINKQILKKINK